jgi:PKD repeat protein
MRKLLFVVSLIMLFSCDSSDPTPKPVVSFDAVVGLEGKVNFEIESQNADTFEWDFGDGITSQLGSQNYVYNKNGLYKVSLTAKGKGGTVSAIRDVRIDNITGSVVFFTQAMRDKNIQVTVGNKSAGTITGSYVGSNEPNCGGPYAATLSGLTEGIYDFSAVELGTIIPTKWSGKITVVGGVCVKHKLTY